MDKDQNVQFYEILQLEKGEENVALETCETEEKQTISWKQFLALIMSVIHYAINGMTAAYPSIFLAQANMEGGWKVTKAEESWIVSICILPMAPASIICGFLLTKFRKKTIILINIILEIIAWVLTYKSSSISELLIARALCGIPNAICSFILTQYLGEVSNPQRRGLYLSALSLGLALGILVIHILGSFLSWDVCALVTAAINILNLCAAAYLPESYGWYQRQGDKKHTERAFYWYRGKTASAKKELVKLHSVSHESTGSNYTNIEMLRMCCGKLMLMPLSISTVAIFTLHFSGAKAIMYHSIDIISQVVPILDQYTSTIIVDVIRLGATALGCIFIKKFRVRQLFIITGMACTLSQIFFFAFYTYGNKQQLFSILILCALISHTVFVSIGLVPTVYIISGEIFPLIVKGVASGINATIYYILLFISVKLTPTVIGWFGLAEAFLFYAACTIVGTIIMYFILPETKNKTLKEIEDLFK